MTEPRQALSADTSASASSAPPTGTLEGTIDPLAGEAGIPGVAIARPARPSRKNLLALGMVAGMLVFVTQHSFRSVFGQESSKAATETRLPAERPLAALRDTKKLDLGTPAAPAPSGPYIPALISSSPDDMEPIGVRRSVQGQAGATASASGLRPPSPEDAPVMLLSARPAVSQGTRALPPSDTDSSAAPPTDHPDPLQATTRNLQGYQRQLQTLMDKLGRTTADASGNGSSADAGAHAAGLGPVPPALTHQPTQTGGLFGGQLQASSTPRASAAWLGNRSLILPKGTAFTCALKTRVISAASGLVGCLVQRDLYSDDGRVLLVERGSHLDGEYRLLSVRPGTVRIPVLWTRLRTPLGVVVDLDSPGTGSLGESGIDGHVDNRWSERLGAAMLLSLIDDSVKLLIQSQTERSEADGSSTVILPATTANTSKLAEKVLDSTINIPPLIYRTHGSLVGVVVARDLDFSGVYALQAVSP